MGDDTWVKIDIKKQKKIIMKTEWRVDKEINVGRRSTFISAEKMRENRKEETLTKLYQVKSSHAPQYIKISDKTL